MTRPLALHHLTAIEVPVPDLVAIAAETGCQKICIFTHMPVVALPGRENESVFPMVTRENLRVVRDRLREYGITVGNIEFFPVTADVPIDVYREGLELGAELGAERAVTHIHDPVDARAIETLGRLADMAAPLNLTLGLEFMGLSPACASVQRAAFFVEQVGRKNVGIGCDALHLARTGGTPANVAAVPAHLFVYSQICDGPDLGIRADYLPEAMDRLLPGAGCFPLKEMIEALPLATELDVEVPRTRLAKPGVSALDHAREVVRRARAIIDSAHVTR